MQLQVRGRLILLLIIRLLNFIASSGQHSIRLTYFISTIISIIYQVQELVNDWKMAVKIMWYAVWFENLFSILCTSCLAAKEYEDFIERYIVDIRGKRKKLKLKTRLELINNNTTYHFLLLFMECYLGVLCIIIARCFLCYQLPGVCAQSLY